MYVGFRHFLFHFILFIYFVVVVFFGGLEGHTGDRAALWVRELIPNSAGGNAIH